MKEEKDIPDNLDTYFDELDEFLNEGNKKVSFAPPQKMTSTRVNGALIPQQLNKTTNTQSIEKDDSLRKTPSYELIDPEDLNIEEIYIGNNFESGIKIGKSKSKKK